MSRNRSFKQRQSSRLNYEIYREQAEERLRIENEEAEARLQNQLDSMDNIARVVRKAFEAIENQASESGREQAK